MSPRPTGDRLREAMERLLAGEPSASAGDLTVSGWAREAGVHRATPYRFPELLEEFSGRVEATHREDGTDLDRLRTQLRELEAEIERARHERSERERSLDAHNRALANRLNGPFALIWGP